MSGRTARCSHDTERVSSEPLVALRGIEKSFGSIAALRGVDLDLFAGECLGLVGDNAAGKSTLTKILAGVHEPDRGRIIVAGEEVRFPDPAAARARRIEMVYQDLSLCDTIDVAGNLFLGREIASGGFLRKRGMAQAAREMLTSLRIRVPDLSATVGSLSGGQRQSVAIARAASFDPLV
jgi:simple sugar transport system ATP-binding protein